MGWQNQIGQIEDLDGVAFDASVVAALEAGTAVRSLRPLHLATPSFLDYTSDALVTPCRGAFPVFSVTGPACALGCDHCQASILAPMRPALIPEDLDRQVRALANQGHLRGFLLSGGSNRRNEIAYERYYPTIERLKRDFPSIKIAVHSALTNRVRARAMASAGVDTAMMDVIGDDQTIRDVYHLDRPAADFAASLDALAETNMDVVPHIVIGLHYGRIRGEFTALDMCARTAITALVLVVVMPVHAKSGLFKTPELSEVVEVMRAARVRMGDRDVHLGCARPPGLYRRGLDAYAVMAEMDSIAFPAEGVVELAQSIGRPIRHHEACCALGRRVATRPLADETAKRHQVTA